MKFGVFMELSVARPWTPESEKRVYDESLAQVQIAEAAGFDQVWVVEHHFMEEHSHCAAPEIFLTAAAMKTTTMRLGTGIVVCVPKVNHPARIAERLAMVDVISGGRVEVGTGRSGTWTELGGFGVNPDTTKKAWDEVVRALPKMWSDEMFSWDGVSFSMPPRNVLPKPIQKPHPPMWVAVNAPGTELDAADRGMGALGQTFGTPASMEGRIAEYRRRIQLCEPVGGFVNDQFATVNFMHCHEDSERAQAYTRRLLDTFQFQAAQAINARDVIGRGYSTAGLLPQLRAESVALSGSASKTAVPEGFAAGDPQRVITVLKGWEAAGVDRINFLLNTGDVVPHAEVCASLELFGREVMPAFQGTADAAPLPALERV